MPIKFVLSEVQREHEDGKNSFWTLLKDVAEFSEIVDQKNWITDSNNFEVGEARDIVSSVMYHIQSRFRKDYPDADLDVGLTPDTSSNVQNPRTRRKVQQVITPYTVTFDDMKNVKFDKADWRIGIPKYIAEILLLIKNGGTHINYNNATRLLHLAFEGLGIKYMDPSEELIARSFYSNLVGMRITEQSEWLNRYPIKLYQNLASSGVGIERIYTQHPNGSKLITYAFDDEMRQQAFRELAQIGLSRTHIDYMMDIMRSNFDLSQENLKSIDRFVASEQESGAEAP